MADILPPHSLEAEEAVLGSLLIDPASTPRIAGILKPSDFYIVKNGWIYEVLIKLGAKADLLTVSSALAAELLLDGIGGDAYLAQLTASVPTALNVDSYAQIVIDFSTRRKIINAGGEMAKLGYDTKTPVLDAQAKIVKLLTKIGGAGNLKVNSATLMQGFDEYMEWLGEPNPANPHRTGIKSVDKVLDGGLYGEYALLAAMPGMGKSSLAVQMAYLALMDGKRVIFAAFEEPRNAIISRMVSQRLARKKVYIPYKTALRKKMSEADMELWQNEVVSFSSLYGKNLVLVDQATMTPIALRNLVIAESSIAPVDLIVVDQLNHMTDPLHGDTKKDKVSNISAMLREIPKDVAHLLGVSPPALLGVTRLGRVGYGNPQLQDLKESGDLESDAQVIMLMSAAEGNPNSVILNIAKQRYGETKTISDIKYVREFNLLFDAPPASQKSP